jgi:hypothetical protein
MTGAPEKEQALAQVLALMDAHGLSANDIRRAAQREKKNSARTGTKGGLRHQILMRVFYYLGGTLIFAGLGIYIHAVWFSLASPQRVLITFGPGFIAYLLGVLFARDRNLEKAAAPAHIIAFILQPIGLFVLLKEYFNGGDAALGSMIVFGPLAIQQALTFLSLRRPSLLLFALLYAYGFAGAATVYYGFDRGISAMACGLFLFFICVHMHQRKTYRDLTPFFYILSTALFFSGLYYHIGRTIYDPLALSISMGLLMFSILRESRTLYVLSVIYIAGYFCGGPGGGWSGTQLDRELAAIFAGTSLLLAGYWIERSNFISLSPVWLFAGMGYVLGGFYGMLYDTAFEPLFAGILTLGLYTAVMLRSRAVLAISILTLIGFISSYTQRYFADKVGWSLLLILFGFLIVMAGFLFARISDRIKKSSAQNSAA